MINGASDQFVVINIPELQKINGEIVGFNGSIVLDGGITPDHVYFNLHRGEDLIGGDPLIMESNGLHHFGYISRSNGIFDIIIPRLTAVSLEEMRITRSSAALSSMRRHDSQQ